MAEFYYAHNPVGLVINLNKKHGADKAAKIALERYPNVTCEEINKGLGYDYFKKKRES